MSQQNKDITWETIQDNEIKRWYYTSKIMKYIFPGNYPEFVFSEIWEQIMTDPEYKKEEDK
jgi:hypothetical protein